MLDTSSTTELQSSPADSFVHQGCKWDASQGAPARRPALPPCPGILCSKAQQLTEQELISRVFPFGEILENMSRM